jgi:protease II
MHVMRRLVGLFAITFIGVACGGEAPAPLPPSPKPVLPRTAASAESPRPAESATPYSGHGADSVPKEVLARYAPSPLPSNVSRRIQSMLDIRSPIGSRIGPDAHALYFAWNVTGGVQVWRVDGPRRFPTQLSGGEDATRIAGITPDGKTLVVSRDHKGEENPGLYLLPADGGALRLIQHEPKVQTHLQWITDDGKQIYFRANDRKQDAYAIYRWDFASGKREMVVGDDGLWRLVEKRGPKLLLEKATGALSAEIWEFDEDAKKLSPLFGQNEKEEYDVAYAPAAGELIVRTSKLGDFRRVYRTKKTGGGPLEAKDVTPITPDAKHDVESFFTDRPRARLYYTTNEAGFTRAHVLDTKTWAEEKLPPIKDAVHVSFGHPTWDGRYVVMNVGTTKAPTTSWVYDWQTRALVQWVTPSTPEIDTTKFVDAALEEYPVRDGTKVPAFVRRPPSCASASEPCPVLVHFHGGPEGQSRPGFNTYAQIFVDAGFVFVEPNVRGSDGYGKAWLHADDGPKRLAVITDIEDAAKWARTAFTKNGKAPKVGVMGGSYGGYSTLVAMTKFAGAYDAGVANVGISNLYSFLMNTAPYRRALRASEYGDPEKDKDALRELSPITFIDKVNAPLFLIQGASDPRVPIGEALQMYDALVKRGVTTGLMVFPDEGHGAQKRENRVLEIGHTLDFFERHLVGKK